MQPLLSTYLENIERLSRQVQEQWGQAETALHEAASKVVEGFTLANQARLEEIARAAQAGATIPIPDLAGVAERFRDLSDLVQRAIAPALDDLRTWIRDLPPRLQSALLTLGEHGWYLDSQMPIDDLWELQRLLEDEKVDEAEERLSDYFQSRLEAIEASVIARFPNRSHLFSAALRGHRQGEYSLSIPVLLAQTDGICMEVVGHYLFTKREGKPCTAIYVEQVAADTLKAALLSPLARPLPISASENQLPKGSDALNRHEVLHGRRLDYGTKKNGLKAVSLINYVATALRSDWSANA